MVVLRENSVTLVLRRHRIVGRHDTARQTGRVYQTHRHIYLAIVPDTAGKIHHVKVTHRIRRGRIDRTVVLVRSVQVRPARIVAPVQTPFKISQPGRLRSREVYITVQRRRYNRLRSTLTATAGKEIFAIPLRQRLYIIQRTANP